MPVERIQQEIAPLIRLSEFKGLRNDRPLYMFEPGDLSVADNVDIDNAGSISLRPGYTQVKAGSFHSLWAEGAQCLVASSGSLCSLDAAYAETILAPLADPVSPISYVKVNDRVYLANGVDSKVVELGTARSWGITPPATLGATATVGLMPEGSYQFVATYVRNDGQESGARSAQTIDVPIGGGLLFALPVSVEPDVSGVNIYLSTPGGEIMYLAVTLPNGTTSYLYTNDTSELTLPLATQFLQGPPAGHLVGYFKGHVYVAVGATLYPSEPYAYELFDLRKGIPMDGRVTMFAPFEDADGTEGVFVGTEKSCGVLIGASPSEFKYVTRVDYGAIEGALTYMDGALYGDNKVGAVLIPMWLTSQGVCVGMPDMSIDNLTRTRYSFAAAGRGAALFISGPNKFIATSYF